MRKVPKWITKYPRRKYAFKDLPSEAKKAVVIYMWGARADVKEVENQERLPFAAIVKEFEDVNGGVPFEIYKVPVSVVAKKAMEEANERDGAGFENLDEWHENYIGSEELPNHKKVWPLLGGDEEEVIQDGWHRLHLYYENGVRIVPVLFFLDFVDNIFA